MQDHLKFPDRVKWLDLNSLNIYTLVEFGQVGRYSYRYSAMELYFDGQIWKAACSSAEATAWLVWTTLYKSRV